MESFHPIDLEPLRALLCDADGNLFASEEPAFDASAQVTNRFLESIGVHARFTAAELRLATTGKNFRTTAMDLASSHGASEGVPADALERWVAEERRQVTSHLGAVLERDEEIVGALEALGRRYVLAAVSSSASSRLAACFDATGLDGLFPEDVRFSAEDSLAVPTSKPDPAIYRLALERLGLDPEEALAVEDAVPGAQSAVAAGIPTIGNVVFVPEEERAARVAGLREAGVAAVVESWGEVEHMLLASQPVPTR